MAKEKKENTIEEMSFKELVDFATIQIHLGLIEEGGKGMRQAVHLWLSQAIRWSEAGKH